MWLPTLRFFHFVFYVLEYGEDTRSPIAVKYKQQVKSEMLNLEVVMQDVVAFTYLIG